MPVPSASEVVWFIGRSGKRIAVTVVGAALVVLGLAMLVLPGPGLLVVFAGFAVLATEYVWAATAVERAKALGTAAKNRITRRR